MDLIKIFAICGLMYTIKEIDGPWGIISRWRNLMMRLPFFGIFFYKLLSCPFCLGCHTGYIVYLLSTPKLNWNVFDFVVWFLAGGSINLLFILLINRLNSFDNIQE